MKAKLIRKSEGRGFVEDLHFVIAVGNKEIPLVTVTSMTMCTQQELGGFDFELCTCTPSEVRAVLRCYQKHSELLDIYFRTCHQEFRTVGTGELGDLLEWEFLSGFERQQVEHFYKLRTDDVYLENFEQMNLQRKKQKKNLEKEQRANRETYMRISS